MNRCSISRVLVILLVVFLSLGAFQVFVGPIDVKAQPSIARLEVWNDTFGSNITSLALAPPNQLSVEVNVTGAGQINAFDVQLRYDVLGSGILDAVGSASLVGGLFDDSNPPEGCSIFILKNEVDVPQGKIRVLAAILGGCSVNGTGTLFTLTFNIIETGVAAIDVVQTDQAGKPATIIAASGLSVPYESFGAYFRNKPGIPPVAEFTYSPGQPVVGNSVAFDASESFDPNNSTGSDKGIRQLKWNFGDGTLPVEGVAPSHIFNLPLNRPASGNFTVTLVVEDYRDGLVNRKTVVVDVKPGVTTPDFALTPSQNTITLQQGSLVTVTITVFSLNGFTGNVSLTAAVNPEAPGSPQASLFPNVVPVAPAFTGMSSLMISALNFTVPGNYNVTVRGTSGSLSHSTTVNVTVEVSTNLPPLASFSFSPLSPEVGMSVFFDGFGSFDPDGFIVSWSWNFGDGFTGSGTFTSHTYFATGNYTVTLTVTDNQGAVGITARTVTVRTSTNQPPTAIFFFNPQNPTVGDSVFFDGSASFDPDGFIVEFQWSFGDGFAVFGSRLVSHLYSFPGNYTVTLTVRDDDGAVGNAFALVNVRSRPVHDVSIDNVYVQPSSAVSSQFVNIQVVLRNKGLSSENVTLTVFYDGNIIETRTVSIQSSTFGYPVYVSILWDTLGVEPGTYTISATASLANDEFPGDNTFTDGTVTILPAPTLTLTPDTGGLGAKVQAAGSGLPIPQYGPPLSIVTVSFDDAFQGFVIARDGQFVFVFNVPHAEPGEHQVKVMDLVSGARTSARFTVLPGGEVSSGGLEVTVDVGAVYFPGETALIYAMTSRDGTLVGPGGVQLELLLVRQDGTTTVLTATSVGTGVYRATFAVPRSGSLGTYAVIAQASMEGLNGSALRTFEVKPSWISVQGPRIASATAIVGLIAGVAVAWQKGYIRKKGNQFPDDSGN